MSRAHPKLAPSVAIEARLDAETARRFYHLYTETFAEVATQAVARQLLHEHEFMEEMQDPRVDKYLAVSSEGEPIAMCTLTRHLETVPWISPQYFERHYPEFAADNRIFYLGFVLVAPQHQRSRVFLDLGRRVMETVVDARGMCAYDICRHNVEALGIAEAIAALAGTVADIPIHIVDTQTYYVGIPRGPRKMPEMRSKSG